MATVWRNIQKRKAIGFALPPKIPSAPASAPVPAFVPEPEEDSSHLSGYLQMYGGVEDMCGKRRTTGVAMRRLHEEDSNDQEEMHGKAEGGSLVQLCLRHLSIRNDGQALGAVSQTAPGDHRSRRGEEDWVFDHLKPASAVEIVGAVPLRVQ